MRAAYLAHHIVFINKTIFWNWLLFYISPLSIDGYFKKPVLSDSLRDKGAFGARAFVRCSTHITQQLASHINRRVLLWNVISWLRGPYVSSASWRISTEMSVIALAEIRTNQGQDRRCQILYKISRFLLYLQFRLHYFTTYYALVHCATCTSPVSLPSIYLRSYA